MPEDTQSTSAVTEPTNLNIPEEVLKKFPEFIELIKKSQSMNDEERQYWIDVLPIMTEDQTANLRSILENEQEQIGKAESEYEEGVKSKLKFDEKKYKEKQRIRAKSEKQHELEEKELEEGLLKEIENM